MKKKISVILCVLATSFLFTACGASNETVSYDEATIEQATEFLIQYCASTDESTVDQWKALSDFELEYQLMQSQLPYTPESFLGALEAWPAAVEECGEYIGHGDFTYEVTADEITVTTEAEFADRNAEIQVIYDENARLDSMTVSAEYGTGEILSKAGLNTLLGMGTVFAVLIFISIIISLMKYIPALGEKFRKKPVQTEPATAEKAETPAPAASATTASAVETVDDAELIAVISAAIAAYEGSGSSDGFVVRSIRRRPSNKWKA